MTSDTQVLSVMSTQLADAVERAGGAQVRVDGRARRPSTGTVWAPELVIAAEHAIEVLERGRVVQVLEAGPQVALGALASHEAAHRQQPAHEFRQVGLRRERRDGRGVRRVREQPPGSGSRRRCDHDRNLGRR